MTLGKIERFWKTIWEEFLERARFETFEEAVETIRKAGLELPPVSAVTNQLADAAVQLVDNGFFFLARGCIFQMWRTMGNDELGSLNRSLG